jgi:hypothetical protein
MSDEIEYRLATVDDETDISNVLEEVAPEVPVRLDGSERQDKIKTLIVERRRSGKSWVAVDPNGKVVGFVLARPDVVEGQAAMFVDYVGVDVDSRGRGIFSTMMEKLKVNDVPLTADVLHENRSGMANRLVKVGFSVVEADGKKTRFRWNPAATRKPDVAAQSKPVIDTLHPKRDIES